MDYRGIFQGEEFNIDGTIWIAGVDDCPGFHVNATDRIIFQLSLGRQDGQGSNRRLKLIGSDAGIHVEDHIPLLHECVRAFLRSDSGEAEWHLPLIVLGYALYVQGCSKPQTLV